MDMLLKKFYSTYVFFNKPIFWPIQNQINLIQNLRLFLESSFQYYTVPYLQKRIL